MNLLELKLICNFMPKVRIHHPAKFRSALHDIQLFVSDRVLINKLSFTFPKGVAVLTAILICNSQTQNNIDS